ncbi:MAG: Pathogenicity locus [Ignavibacteria bacterium]|nr:Pathogenicity locus [Ignavibacteria bacterium]
MQKHKEMKQTNNKTVIKSPDENKNEILKQFQIIPGVGKSIAVDLWDLGYRSVAEIKNESPEKMYEKSCELEGVRIDRCLLYVYKCAVYFASNSVHDPELLKWWNWKS